MPRLAFKDLKIRRPFLPCALPAAVFFYEVIFALLVSGRPQPSAISHMLLSSVYLTALPVIFILVIEAKDRRVAGPVAAVLILLFSLPFLIEFFIHMQFRTFYDVNTVLNGGEGALTGFGQTIKSLVLSASGIRALLLYILPTIIFVTVFVLTGKEDPVPVKKTVIILLTVSLFALGLDITAYGNNEFDSRLAGEEYSFQEAVPRLGLMTAIRLDLKNGKNGDLTFSDTTGVPDYVMPTFTPTPSPTPAPSLPDATPTPSPSPTPVPVPQVMDIDFDRIAEESSGTISSLATYCGGLTPSNTNNYTGLFEGKNLILITAEAFTAEVIDPELTPTLYRLAYNGINFNDFYVPATAGTTGGEFTHLFGLLPTLGGASVPHMTSRGDTFFTMGNQLEGYFGMAFHNNDYTFYSRNTTHDKLGYSDGFMGWGNGMEEFVDPVWPESDLQMFQGSVPLYIDREPFNVYYMTVSGHRNYSRGANAMAREHWDETAFMEDEYSERVRAYIAANLELEASMNYLVSELEARGIEDDTVICIVADHYPYGLDRDAPPGNMPYLSELYGYDVTNYMERDHNRAIIWCGCLEDQEPIIIDSPASSMDLLPTLLNLFGCEWDSRLFPGRDVLSDAMPLYFNLNYDWKTDLGTYINSRNEFIPASEDIVVPDGYVDAMREIVSDKITYTRGCISSDFFAYILPVEED